MKIKVIKNESDYNEALKRAYLLMHKENKDDADYNEMEVLGVIIEKYEDRYWVIDKPDPISAIEFRMEQDGLKQVDLVKLLGKSKSVISKLLKRQINLSVDMIMKLNKELKIPYESLLSDGH